MTNRLIQLGVCWLVVCLAGCSSLIFYPEEKHYLTPAMLQLESKEVYFNSDSYRLHGWWLQTNIIPKGTILFLHGNAENISTHINSVYWLPKHGYNVFLFDYRGYGKSEGKPDLDGVHQDYAAALEYLFALPEDETKQIFVFGQSLGGAIALTGTAESQYKDKIRAVIVDGTFGSFRQLAREKLGNSWLTWLFQWPLSYTIRDDYRPLDKIEKISPTPILIIHSQDDEVIPFHYGQELFQRAREPKMFWSFTGIRHVHVFTQVENQKKLLEYLQQHGKP